MLPLLSRKVRPKPKQVAHDKMLLMLKMNKNLLKPKETKLLRIRKQQLKTLEQLNSHKQAQNKLIQRLKQIW